MKTLRYYCSIALRQWRMDSHSNWIYKSYLIPWMIGIPLQLLAEFYVLKLIIDRVGNISGWQFPEVTFLFAVSMICHGADDLLFIHGWHIERMILRGDFDRFLLRPAGVFFQFATEAFNWSGFFSIVPGTVLLGYACWLLPLALTPRN